MPAILYVLLALLVLLCSSYLVRVRRLNRRAPGTRSWGLTTMGSLPAMHSQHR